MTGLDGRISDDSSSILSLTLSQSASQSSGSVTNLSPAGGSTFSVLRQARGVKDQLEAVNEATVPQEVCQLPKIWVFNYAHVKMEWLYKKRKRWSKVDQHGERYVRLGGDDTSLGEYWLCNLYKHVERAPPESAWSVDRPCRRKLRIRRFKASSSPSEDPQESRGKVLVSKSTGQLLRETLLAWATDTNIPFAGIEHPLFCQLLYLLHKDLLQELLPQSGDTVKAWMKAEFEAEKEPLKNELESSPYKKHLAFDLWTSPNQ
ncbi:hypothetical protein MRS44_017511 [Fusarium solani]|uniref:uncharacterized protein n=1 Tax=Fusarium solani TaxID=169388 RepID=UPI0032C48256|nr:hypothetical protein MRS44_017511 [Fusarium solani]